MQHLDGNDYHRVLFYLPFTVPSSIPQRTTKRRAQINTIAISAPLIVSLFGKTAPWSSLIVCTVLQNEYISLLSLVT